MLLNAIVSELTSPLITIPAPTLPKHVHCRLLTKNTGFALTKNRYASLHFKKQLMEW